MLKLKLKRTLGRFYPASRYGRKIILLYHSVGDSQWGMSTRQFSEQMKWISEHCQVMKFSELLRSESTSHVQVAISFDDGYQTLLQEATPIVSKYDIYPIVYLNTGWIGETDMLRKKSQPQLGHYPGEFFLTWSEVKELHHLGWEIGSHGINHFNFRQIPFKQAGEELLESKLTIEKKLGQPCPHFAYPFGRYLPETQRIVKEVGYETAVAVRHDKLHSQSPQFALPRINVANDYSLKDFKQIMLGKWDYIKFFQQVRGMG